MANYMSYPDKKSMSSRLNRKGARNKVFMSNKKANRKLRSECLLRRQKPDEV